MRKESKMNCEKCKNRKATLFYADEEGNRHALCATCGALQGKISTLRSAEEKVEVKEQYLPDITLTALLRDDTTATLFQDTGEGSLICGGCKMAFKDVKASGRVGCPQCYLAFGELLFPDFTPDSPAPSGRMPLRRKKAIERQKSVADLRRQISSAIAEENYELAAALRDKVKRLETENN